MEETSGVEIPYYPVQLWLDDKTPNQKNVSAYVALTGKTVNIKDAYQEDGLILRVQKILIKSQDIIQSHF